MKKTLLFPSLVLVIFLMGCKKDSDGGGENFGTTINTWTFTEGGTTYKGHLLFDASLNTLLQGNNSYTYSMIGPEEESGYFFNLVMSLLDLDFTTTTYQSGVSGTAYLNAFYYFEDFGMVEENYKSSNHDPGPVMNYTVTAYNASTDVVTITFSGQAKVPGGAIVNITNGKVTARNERL